MAASYPLRFLVVFSWFSGWDSIWPTSESLFSVVVG